MNEKCLFCLISLKKIPAYIIEENDYCLAFLDIDPASEGHVLIITKKHYDDLGEVEQIYWDNMLPILKELINKLKKIFPNIKGFNVVSNLGSEAYQSVFHLHVHLIPKYKKKQGFIWSVKNDTNILNPEKVYQKIISNLR